VAEASTDGSGVVLPSHQLPPPVFGRGCDHLRRPGRARGAGGCL